MPPRHIPGTAPALPQPPLPVLPHPAPAVTRLLHRGRAEAPEHLLLRSAISCGGPSPGVCRRAPAASNPHAPLEQRGEEGEGKGRDPGGPSGAAPGCAGKIRGRDRDKPPTQV
eukprot:CAMPEP_0194313134 /NCGR_PEP_ID=MMETSP0171-20130528/10033_1 /TAXON_ID=218684 /ORGANISM="Corethron pennatum, Strain L29A3" /LENGTH=112 /DNA_ID=CAMNT_0039067961 /DNA_START=167 /DNA_END=505 /DNA_ORIENTATION=-